MGHQHAELRSPVADVVLAMDGVPLELEHARDAVADDGAAQVADVHLLGQVRAGQIDHDRLGLAGEFNTHAIGGGVLARRNRHQALRDVRRFDAKVDKARPGDLGRLAHVGHVEGGHDVIGHVARLSAEPFGYAHRAVRLVVAELRVLRRLQQRIALGPGALHGVAYALVQFFGNRLHRKRFRRISEPNRQATFGGDAVNEASRLATRSSLILCLAYPVGPERAP